MKQHPNNDQVLLLKQILREVQDAKADVKDVKKDEKNNRFHLARHSKIMVYLQGIVKKLWDESELREKEEKEKKDEELDKSKEKVEKLTKLLISILVTICLLAVGVNNVPEAVAKLMSLL